MTDPSTFGTMLQGAISHHELFMSYVQAGFTRAEALELLKLWITINYEQVDQKEEKENDGR